jgi:hypothetical protein
MTQAFFEAVRKASLPGTWSQGVKLAREKAVVRLSASDEELTARVRTPGRGVSPTVTLHLLEEEWTCDCTGPTDPCAHVAAAAIALTQGLMEASAEPGGPGRGKSEVFVPPMRVVYRFRTEGRQLMLQRFIVRRDGKQARIARSLIVDLGRGTLPLDLEPTHGDL